MQRFTKRAEAFYALFCAAAFTIFQDVFFPRRGQSHTFCCRQTKKQAFIVRRSCKKAHTDKKAAPRVKPLSADAADPQKMTKYPECGFLYHSSNGFHAVFCRNPVRHRGRKSARESSVRSGGAPFCTRTRRVLLSPSSSTAGCPFPFCYCLS